MTKNTKANFFIANLQSQLTIAISITQSLSEKHYFLEKLSNPEFYDKNKQKLCNWIYSLNVILIGNADYYPIESNKIRYLVERLIKKVLNHVKY